MEPFHVCQSCYALVLDEFIIEHQGWHENLQSDIDFARTYEPKGQMQ
jgi:alpha-D-ribose 1-methylphosphonate 5-phosphate C-P lyase